MRTVLLTVSTAIILAILLLPAGCQQIEEYFEEPVERDMAEIREEGTLRVVTGYSPVSYFIYRGQPRGYEYELLQRLTDHLDLDMELEVARDLNEMKEMLNSGEVDLIAYHLTVTPERQEEVAFTKPLNETRQVLVQRRPDGWSNIPSDALEQQLVRDPGELAGERVTVRGGSAYISNLRSLADSLQLELELTEAPGILTTEQLIRQVADQEIDYTVADENIAAINQPDYPDLDVRTVLSGTQDIAWAVRDHSPELLEEINDWIDSVRGTTDFAVIYNKYFENRRAFRARHDSGFLTSVTGRISPYDNLIREYAEQIDWDWRMLSSLIYKESMFDPHARSWAGAVGLMQLMPRTAHAFGATDPLDPEQNMRAGIRFLQWLQNYWQDRIEDEHEREKFILASYNVGQGHVQDARRLAEKYGADPDVWFGEVEEYMKKKSDPQYFTDEVVQFGYARGIEPVNYVRDIFYLYSHYQRVTELAEAMAEVDEVS